MLRQIIQYPEQRWNSDDLAEKTLREQQVAIPTTPAPKMLGRQAEEGVLREGTILDP